MKIIPRENLEKYSLPLPLYKSIKIADAIGKDGSEFDVLVGLDQKGVEQLRELSANEEDTDLQNLTGDWRRFVEGTYEDWYKKVRSPFALVYKPTNSLAAVVWFGPKSLGTKSAKFGEVRDAEGHKTENDWHTISFRSYPGFRGRGLMKNFSIFAVDTYKRFFPNVKFWTGTDDRNSAFIRLITSLGFTTDEESSDLAEHWLIMTRV